VAEPTATPDVRQTVDAAAGAKRLVAIDPRFGTVMTAVQTADVDTFLASLTWIDARCGQERGVYCPGVVAGTSVRVLDIGGDFFTTADGLKPSLRMLFGGEPLRITFISQLKDTPSRYYVGFESATVKGKGVPPVTDPDLSLTGIFLTLDASATQPVVDVDFGVNREFHATDKGLQRDSQTQNIITFEAVSAKP
jgi:hypothetical protein